MSLRPDAPSQSQVSPQQPRRRRGLSSTTVFTAIAILVGTVVIAIAMTRQDIESVKIPGAEVHFIESAAGNKVTASDVATADLDRKADELEAKTESQAAPSGTGAWQYFRWVGNNGLTYDFSAYGDQLVFQEVSPAFGVTAVGSGTMDSAGVHGTYQAADGSTGWMELSVQGGDMRTLAGEFRNSTYGTVVPVVMHQQ